MKMIIKEKSFSWKYTRFNVINENEELIFTTVGYNIFDSNKKEVVKIQPLAINEYRILINNKKEAVVKANIGIFKPTKFNVSDPNWEIRSNLISTKFNITHNNETLATITRKIISWSAYYEADILDSVDKLLVLSITLAIHFHLRSYLDNS